MTRKLTAVAVANARHGAKRVEMPAGHGLYLVVQARPSNGKSWAVRYRYGGKSKKLTLGPATVLRPGEVARASSVDV